SNSSAPSPDFGSAAASLSPGDVTRGPEVSSAEFDASPPLSSLQAAPAGPRWTGGPLRVPKGSGSGAPLPLLSPRLAAPPSLFMPAPSLTFDGVGTGFTGPGGTFTVTGAPSDSDGDVGPNHYISIV